MGSCLMYVFVPYIEDFSSGTSWGGIPFHGVYSMLLLFPIYLEDRSLTSEQLLTTMAHQLLKTGR